MMKIFVGLGLIGALILSIAVTVLAYKFADFFISRRELYIKSRYEIFLMKIGWCIFWFILMMDMLVGALNKYK